MPLFYNSDFWRNKCNLYSVFYFQQKDFWKAELRDFSIKNGYEMNRNVESGPMLLDVLEGYLKYEVCY